MSTTALLVRWMHGYLEVTQPGATVREEGFLKAGGATSAEEATVLGATLLDRLSVRDEDITAVVEGALAAGVGDTLTAPDSEGTASTWRVVGIAYSQDGEGQVIRTPLLELVP